MKENNNNHCTSKIRRIIIRVPKEHTQKVEVNEDIMNALLHSLFEEELKGTRPSCGVGARKVMWCHTHKEHDGHRSINPQKAKVKIRKIKAYKKPETKESFISEICPHCDAENTFLWDVTNDVKTPFCAHCGNPMRICSICEDQRCGKCPYEE